MLPIKWEKEAAENFKKIMKELPPYRQERLNDWLDVVREWPPKKWYQLRDEGGFIAFRLDNEKFLKILGCFDEKAGVVCITHFEWRTR